MPGFISAVAKSDPMNEIGGSELQPGTETSPSVAAKRTAASSVKHHEKASMTDRSSMKVDDCSSFESLSRMMEVAA